VQKNTFSCLENEFAPLIPEHYGWMIENDELKPISYEGQGLPTIEQYDQAVSSYTGAEASGDEDDNESSGSDYDVISAEEDDDSDGDLM
jgi:hypothetical protein